jgi:unsaturated rhamnogalacturonyl hydrolase
MEEFFALLTAVFLMTPCTADTKPDDVLPCDEKMLGLKLTQNLLARDYMLYHGGKGLHYAEACTGFGALRFAENTRDKALIEKIIARYEKFLEADSFLISRQSHVDHSVEGIVPLQIYLLTGDERYLKVGLSFAESQWEEPREDGLTSQTRWWIDDMCMVGMLQIQAYRATRETKYADRAALQLTSYIGKLQQPNGLFFHGPEFHYHWGRGNGWVAASMAEVLKSLPADHSKRSELMAGYRKMMASLLKFQSDNGMWRQLIDYEYSWAESSCTAMFAYARTVGVHQGWLDRASYLPAVEKAWKALCAHVDREGNVREVCAGTGQTDDIEFYLKRPRTVGDFRGQAPVLWLINESLESQVRRQM